LSYILSHSTLTVYSKNQFGKRKDTGVEMVRKFFIFMALALVILSGVSPAAAKGTKTRQVIRETAAPWTITPGNCASVNTEISGSGQRYKVVVTKMLADGSTQVTENDRVSGTAVDANGATYKFLYLNRAIYTTPPSGTPVAIKMKDLFVLKGESSAENNLRVAFNWSWTYDPNTSAIWPPVDNWVKHFTLGDPFGCDPI
jgi:hypothetical protein